jgi:coenzyme F420 biosynthesis associated uncharacterized protein
MRVSNAVSWEVAQRVATWVESGREFVGGALGHPSAVLAPEEVAGLEADFAEATTRAEALVIAATGLHPAGPARAKVVDRADWVTANIVSFRHLLDPVLGSIDAATPPGPLASVSQGASGAQLGALLGWMSTRVLGQYDVLFADGTDGGDVVSYVGPNIVALERRYGLNAPQFRLWIALHEVTHRCQFTGVPWLREYFLSLVDEGLSALSPDPRHLVEALSRAVSAIRRGDNPLEHSGVLGLVASPEQMGILERIQGLMSLLEGHGDVTMNRAGAGAVPDAPRFACLLRERRQRASFPVKALQQLMGIDAKLRQYTLGAAFVEALEEAGGDDLFQQVWVSPEWLPTLAEIRDPARWLARADAAHLLPG